MVSEMEHTAARILGDWAMMLVEPDSTPLVTEIIETDLPLYAAALKFKGLISGRYVIICNQTFAKVLTQNLLASDEEPSETDVLDSLKEMVNVFGGNLLTATYGTHEAFALTSPEARTITPEEVKVLAERKVIWLRGDGEPVGVAFIPESVAT